MLGVAPPLTPADLAPFYGGTLDENGHTEWVEGDVRENGIVNGLLMDGSVRSISNSIDQIIWRALGTRAGGEPIGEY